MTEFEADCDSKLILSKRIRVDSDQMTLSDSLNDADSELKQTVFWNDALMKRIPELDTIVILLNIHLLMLILVEQTVILKLTHQWRWFS